MQKIASILFALIVLVGCKQQDTILLNETEAQIGYKVPDMAFTNVLNSAETSSNLYDYREKLIILDFWATWCGVCSTVSPSVDFLSKDYQVVTVALSSGTNERVQRYLNAKEYDFNVINDEKGLISRQWGISVTPTLFFINKGEISSVTTGFTSPLGIWGRLFLSQLS